MKKSSYRGRLAPSPTGRLHAGHLSTFKIVADRCQKANGTLVYRDDDLDQARCTAGYSRQAMIDIQQMQIKWHEGPDCGGPYAPYNQKSRLPVYLKYFQELLKTNKIYPCKKSRKEIRDHLSSKSYASKPQDSSIGNEPVFPLEFRRKINQTDLKEIPGLINWRFEVPDEKTVFFDKNMGEQFFRSSQDFGDFLVWRKDGYPGYEFATVIDDHLMQITEVVRGADLLVSTARQLLIYKALNWKPPDFFHCPLVLDKQGNKLSKRSQIN